MRCASCDIELTGRPVQRHGEAFCCPGCAARGPCHCSYEEEPRRYRANGHADPSLVKGLWDEGPGAA